MLNFSKSLAVLCLVLALNVIIGETSSHSNLRKINDYLVSAIKNDDFDGDIKAIHLLYEKESKKSSIFNESYLKTLKQLISLREINCQGNLATLKKFNELTNYDVPYRRIDNVIGQLTLENSKNCQNIYPKAYAAKAANLDQAEVDKVKTFTSLVFKDWNKNESDIEDVQSMDELYHKYIKDAYMIIWAPLDSPIYRALEVNMKGSSDLKYLKLAEQKEKNINLQKLRDILKEHLIRPCKYYVDKLGPEVFEPANFYSKRQHLVDESQRDFYQAWTRFNFCEKFLKIYT